MNQVIERPLTLESKSIRESFLQAATFIGRETELTCLSQAVTKTLAGAGSAWLVGGESGVGKTRLLDEFKARALVRGVLLLNGQAVSEGGLPYQLWRQALRRLCLHTELSGLEASVIKPYVPDIETLLARPVADAPEVDTENTHRRLLTTIKAIFRRQKRPYVLFWEDLHWADEGSLEVLRELLEILPEIPLLIVGSYRSDETPRLPQELPGMEMLFLERFEETAVKELATSMLGMTLDNNPQIVDLLLKETEGNVFFWSKLCGRWLKKPVND